MARKARDYRAEERRRNELARAQGFTSRAAKRHAIETGKIPAVQPQRLRKPNVIAAQQARIERVIFSERQAERMVENEQYSHAHANRQIAKFDYRNALPGVTLQQFTDAYWNAFANPRGGYDRVRRHGGSAALRRYFVDITGHFTADEYETRYGHAR